MQKNKVQAIYLCNNVLMSLFYLVHTMTWRNKSEEYDQLLIFLPSDFFLDFEACLLGKSSFFRMIKDLETNKRKLKSTYSRDDTAIYSL